MRWPPGLDMAAKGIHVHLLAIGDIGPLDDMIHIGDEAMFDEAIRQLRQRGVDQITAVSSNSADTTRRYGVASVTPLGVSASDDEALASPLGAAIDAADAVLVTGGGNLSSLWPTHIVERARLARLAARRGIPFVVTGQTIGPALTAEGRDDVGRMLASARLVGTRERPSYDLALELGVEPERCQQTIDDASFLADDTSVTLPSPAAVITLARHVGDVDPDAAANAIAQLLDTVADVTGLELVFLAHFGSLRSTDVGPNARGDSAMHERVIARMRTSRIRLEPTTDAPSAARIARAAELVVSSRYHPAVFAASAAVPTIGIPVDDYTDVKLRGALGPIAADGILPMAELLEGRAPSVVADVWSRADALRDRSVARVGRARTESSAWWDRVRTALDG